MAPTKGQRKGGAESVAQGPRKDLASTRGNGSCGTREPPAALRGLRGGVAGRPEARWTPPRLPMPPLLMEA